MIRIFVFPLLGPLLGMACFIVEVWLFSGQVQMHFPEAVWSLAMMFAYLFGLPPAIVTGIVDWLLKRVPLWLRIAVAFGVGFGATLVMAGLAFKSIEQIFGGIVLAGLIGATPAVICSWLSGKIEERAEA